MGTRETAAAYRIARAAQMIAARRESGQNIREYCISTGISRNTYFYWQRKLRESACEQLRQRPVEPGFAEVRAIEPSSQALLPAEVGSGRLSIEVGGIRISADSAYPSEKLAALLRELSRTC